MATRSGQIAVTTAGTAVQGPSTPAGNMWQIAAHPSNTGVMYVGDNGSGTVDSTNGYPLKPGDEPIIVQASNLSAFHVNASVNGEKVCWFLLS